MDEEKEKLLEVLREQAAEHLANRDLFSAGMHELLSELQSLSKHPLGCLSAAIDVLSNMAPKELVDLLEIAVKGKGAKQRRRAEILIELSCLACRMAVELQMIAVLEALLEHSSDLPSPSDN